MTKTIDGLRIQDLIRQGSQCLAHVSSSARLDAEILLAHVLGKERIYLRTWPQQEINPEGRTRYRELIEKRRQGKGIAYLLGSKEFWSLELFVSEDTLIPRPETELLVEKALDLLDRQAPLRLADLGTGSGAIALALAKSCPSWQVMATDINKGALEIAQKNAEKYKLDNIQIKPSYWFENLSQQKFHAILSNPPYIAALDPLLCEHVARNEPQQALIAEDNGLADLRTIIGRAVNHLEPGGWLILEHGMAQAEAVTEFLQQNQYQQIETFKDLAGLERCTVGCKAG